METILDFLVDNYIWVLIISIVLILILIGYIADQKRKLKKLRQQKEQPVNNSGINVNTPIKEENIQQTINENSSVVPEVTQQVNSPINEEIPVEEPVSINAETNNVNTPIKEEVPQPSSLDVPEVDSNQTEKSDEQPEVVEIPEIIEEVKPESNVTQESEIIEEVPEETVNSWEPELVEEQKNITNTEEKNGSI